MSFVISLPRYRCHKEVHALKIEHVIPNPRGAELHFVDKRFVPVPVNHGFIAKHNPMPGRYWVLYPDGYQSVSPAEAFEDGYTLVDAGGQPLEAKP